MLEHKPTTSITHISSLFTILESKGIDKKAFLADADIDPSILKSQEEGTMFSEILDQIRKDTAIYYL